MNIFMEKMAGSKMGRRCWLLLLAFCWVQGAIAAPQPADKAVLNHTQVMFAWDEYPGADKYQLTINGKGTGQQILVKSLAYLLTQGLSFGRQYQWSYTAIKNGKKVFQSPSYSFRVEGHPLVDTNLFRYRVSLPKLQSYQDNLIFIDHLGVAVNRQGQPVWYMPFDSFDLVGPPKYRNLQITPSGSFIFLRGNDCTEKDIQGQLLWTGPNDGAVSLAPTEFYHHDFAKDANGHYMVGSYQYVEMPNLKDPAVTSKVRYNTVIQYDASGKVVWQWNEKDHVRPEVVFAGAAPGEVAVPGTHWNGFSCNDKAGVCVFSFRNNSSLLVIEKATGNVLCTLEGEKAKPGGIAFAAQHSPVFLPNGDLLFYNNNVKAQPDSGQLVFPKILQLHFDKQYRSVQKVWEYECRLKDYPEGLAGKEGFANLLPNGHILICLGGGSKIWEVDRAKKIVWEMDTEAYDAKTQAWKPFSNYRSHFASSLYPRFFTVQQISGKGPVKAGQNIQIKINNDGSEADTYKVELFSNDAFTPYNQTFRIEPGASLQKTIALKTGQKKITDSKNQHFVIVRITPLGNPGAAKNLAYEMAGR